MKSKNDQEIKMEIQKVKDHWCLPFFSDQVDFHPHPFCFLFTSCKNLLQVKKDVKQKQ
jgi:hypothetical protein